MLILTFIEVFLLKESIYFLFLVSLSIALLILRFSPNTHSFRHLKCLLSLEPMEQRDPYYPFVFQEYILPSEFTPFCQFTSDLEVFRSGLAFLNDTIVEQLEMMDDKYRNFLFLADIKNKKLIECVYFDENHDGYSLDITSYFDILDLDSVGSRWEGECVNNLPCGWGQFYDTDGCLAYEGFRFMDTAVCYGCFYHDGGNQIEYEGSIHNGQRWGKGILHDRAGKVVYEGDWLCNLPLLSLDKHVIHSYSGSLRLHLSDCVSPNFCVLHALKRLVISFCSCRFVKSFFLRERPYLEEVVIESFSFTSLHQESSLSNDHGIVTIADCPKLKIITIEENCFRDSAECRICSNLVIRLL